MARGRMLNKSVSGSVKFHNLPDDTCRLLATWIIAHLDVQGVFYGDPAMVKSIVFPRRTDITARQIDGYLTALQEQHLMVRYGAKGDIWQYWPGFLGEQIGLRADRETPDYPPPPDSLVDDPWGDDGNLPASIRQVSGKMPAEEKLSEVKRIDGDADASPPESDDNEQQRSRSEHDKTRLVLEEHFADKTGLPRPKADTAKQKRSAGTLWWGPLREIAELCDWDQDLAVRLIDVTVDHLKGNVTIANPKSILKTAQAVYTGNAPGVPPLSRSSSEKRTVTIKDPLTGELVQVEATA